MHEISTLKSLISTGRSLHRQRKGGGLKSDRINEKVSSASFITVQELLPDGKGFFLVKNHQKMGKFCPFSHLLVLKNELIAV